MRDRLLRAVAVGSLALPGAGGCTSDQAAPWGKLMFVAMVVFLIAIPVAFYRAWRRRDRP